MARYGIILGLMAVGIWNAGCRSDADKMAQFCIELDGAVERAPGCGQMARDVAAVLDGNRFLLSDVGLCVETPACYPCRRAVSGILGSCGYSEAMSGVLERFHFSGTLRKMALGGGDGAVAGGE